MDFTDVVSKLADEDKPRFRIRLSGKVIVALILVIIVLACVLMSQNVRRLREQNDELKRRIDELIVELDNERKIDVTYVGNKLESISELTTAKMTYNGIIHFEEGRIRGFTKKEFYMAYRVSLKAGIDLDNARIHVTDDAVIIQLPGAEIYEPTVDEKSFQYFDKSIGFFVDEEMDDLAQAISKAKEDALAQPETQEMKETAEKQAMVLLTGLLEGQIGERELIVEIG